MAGLIGWLKDVPPGALLADENNVVMSRSVFELLDDYTRSSPTGASPGRVWRQDHHWSGPPSNWFVYVSEREEGGVSYFGRPVLLVEDGAP